MSYRFHLALVRLPFWRRLARILARRVPPDARFGRFRSRDEP
jgi:hypothetical protein